MKHALHPLRPLRPKLVKAAEDIFGSGHTGKDKKLKSQLNHLIAVCNEATCHEEIRLYLRYQSTREGRLVAPELVESINRGIETVFQASTPPLTDPDQQVAAWRLYAVYLARAFTYHTNAGSPQSPDRNRDSRRTNPPTPKGRQ